MRLKTLLFISIAFGGSIVTAVLLYLRGLPITSPAAELILGLFLMPSPAVATCVVHRFHWREIVDAYGLDVRKLDYRYLGCSTVLFFLSFFVLFLTLIWVLGNLLNLPGIGQLTLSSERVWQEITTSNAIATTVQAPTLISLVPLLLTLAFFAAIVAGFSINGLFAFGEELGWRGFLWSQLRPYGLRGRLLLGIIWGLWHAPIILLGYNYPHHPYLGVLFMLFLTTSLTFPLTFLRDQSRTVYSPSIVHGMINASGILSYVVVNKNDLIGGVAGVTGCAAMLLAWLVTDLILPEPRPRGATTTV